MRVQITGAEKALNAFNQLPPRMQFKHMRIALNAAAGVVRDRARTIVLKQTRLLARSLTIKVKIPNASYNPKHWGKPEYAVIGPSRRAFSQIVQGVTKSGRMTTKTVVSTSGKGRGGGGRKLASRYAHIIEKGSSRSMGYSFLDTAVRTEGTVASSKAIKKLEQGLQQEAAKLSAGTP